MTDERKPAAARPPRTLSNPGALKAVSAARAQPLAQKQSSLTKDRLKSGAENTALNALSILRETWEDFRNSDRFFKYKAAIIALWIGLSVTSFAVACPGTGNSNRIGAKLVTTEVSGRPVVSIQNAGDDKWEDVLVLVNTSYRAAVASIDPDQTVTLTPKQWVGPDGQTAPSDLKVSDVEVRTSEGNTVLLVGGLKP
jgi:hypothetical protein